jgi:hypothetical protein
MTPGEYRALTELIHETLARARVAAGRSAEIRAMAAELTVLAEDLGALVRAYRRAVANGTQLRLVVPAEIVRRVLSGNGLDRLVSVYPSREAAIAAGPPVAETSAAGPPQVSQYLLDGIVRNLFHAGLSLQAALDAAHETDRQYIMEALRYVDEAIRDIRDHIFTTGRREIPPSSGPPDGAR